MRQCVADSVPERRDGAGRGPSQARLQLGKRVLDRVEVGRVGRQKPEPGTCRVDRSTDAGNLVGGQIIHHDGLAWSQGGDEHLLDIREESRAVHWPIKHHGCGQAAKPEGRDERDRFPVMGWTPPKTASSCQSGDGVSH